MMNLKYMALHKSKRCITLTKMTSKRYKNGHLYIAKSVTASIRLQNAISKYLNKYRNDLRRVYITWTDIEKLSPLAFVDQA
jgi:hypothetical protein